jgi:3,4-dihydroxy 2-butanone 4-phosphate synthase/GTP cyclohydrolase II
LSDPRSESGRERPDKGGDERVQRAIEEIRAGRMIILVDDEDRENEGDLTMAAEKVTPEAINFMAKHGRGLICLTLTEDKADALDLPLQATRRGGPPLGTAFTVSIEARRGVSTGISAADRAHTIRTAVAPDARPSDLITPGHVFPLRAKTGGVLVRTGQTEGSVDLARLAGLQPAGVICEIMNDDGSMARMPDLERFAADHNLMILSIADLIGHRLRAESLVERASAAQLTPAFAGVGAEFAVTVYRTPVERTEFMALTLGDVAGDDVLVRVQTACIPGDVFGSPACDCGAQLRASLQRIEAEGRGVLLYVFAGGRHSVAVDVEGHVLHRETAVTHAMREGKLREFGLGAQVLADLGVRRIRLMTNNPRKIVGLEGYGITVGERVPLEIAPTRHNLGYLQGKRDREGHLLASEQLAAVATPAATALGPGKGQA